MIWKSGIHREMASHVNNSVGGAVSAQTPAADADAAIVMARAIESPIPLEHFRAAVDAEIAPGRQGSRSILTLISRRPPRLVRGTHPHFGARSRPRRRNPGPSREAGGGGRRT